MHSFCPVAWILIISLHLQSNNGQDNALLNPYVAIITTCYREIANYPEKFAYN